MCQLVVFCPPSWIVTFPSYCHYEGSSPWPRIVINRLQIYLCCWFMSYKIYKYLFWRPYFLPSWNFKFLQIYCHYEGSIPWFWSYRNRISNCLCSWPKTYKRTLSCDHLTPFGDHLGKLHLQVTATMGDRFSDLDCIDINALLVYVHVADL